MEFAEAQRAAAVSRLRRATFLLLPPLTLAIAVNLRAFGESTPLRMLALLGMLGLAAVTHVLVGERFAGRRAIPIAIVFITALGVLMLGVLAESPERTDVRLGTLTALMMGAAIVIPWGVWPQLMVACLLAGAYAFLPGPEIAGSAEVVHLLVALVDCVALSAVGAWVLDRQRRAAFAEREHALRMTRHREVLLAAGRELNASLDADALGATITRVGCSIVDADTVALVLIDDRRQVLRTVAVAGNVLDLDREVMHLELPVAALDELVHELRVHGWAYTPGERLGALAELAREQFGVLATLFVAIERKGTLLGYVNFNFRRRIVTFTDDQIRLARGFAAQCAIALANARLVGDLQRADRVKSEFVSTMSHELRTPLSVILGYADVLEESVRDVEGRLVLDRIRAAGRDLLDLVQATLDLNRLESGQDPARPEAVPLQEIWDELAVQFEALARPAGVVLRWEVAGVPIAATDRRKLKIVMKNLVGNALKFTAAGEVHVSVRGAGPRCLVVVRDTGIGIPAEDLAGIFDMFRQVDNTDTRTHGGVGLGLYIVRKLVEQLDATLDVRSTVGQGTTFALSLPAVASLRAVA
jgi:signal transduction histidine kinase